MNWSQLLEQDDRVKVAGSDIDGISRGKIISKSKFLKSMEQGFGYCDVIFGWDCHDKLYSVETKNSTFVDLIAKPDLQTYRRIPWEKDIPFFILDFYEPGGKMLEFAPRGLLKTVLKRLTQQGFIAMVGMEYEWYNFKGKFISLLYKLF
jgi:glutamine synthetase